MGKLVAATALKQHARTCSDGEESQRTMRPPPSDGEERPADCAALPPAVSQAGAPLLQALEGLASAEWG